MKQQSATADAKNVSAKTSSITLRADGAVLTLLAVRKENGTAVTTATTKHAGDTCAATIKSAGADN